MKNPIYHLAFLCLVIAIVTLLPTTTCGQSNGTKADAVHNENSTDVRGITTARARSLVGVGLGAISIGIGWVAKKRTNNMKNPRALPIVGLILAISAIALSIAHLFSTSGGFGTGGGKAGAIVALLLGLIGATFCVLRLRSNGS